MDFIITPGDGIGPVKFGMSHAEVHRVLASLPGALERHHCRGSHDYYFGNALQVEYRGPDGGASFIGASFYPGCGCTFSLLGQNPWSMSAEDLFAALARLDGGNHRFNRTEYVFPRIIVTLWDADPQYDHLGGGSRPVYGEVGVGSAAYLDASRRIRKKGTTR